MFRVTCVTLAVRHKRFSPSFRMSFLSIRYKKNLIKYAIRSDGRSPAGPHDQLMFLRSR